MPDLKLDQVEASLKAARRRSKRRFLLFITLILVIWGATYFYTKGEFYFFTKKIAVTDTIVVDQTAAITARDQMIADQSKLIVLLQDSLQKVSALLPRPAARPVSTKNDEAARLRAQIILRERERLRRDSILQSRKQLLYEQYPNVEQNSLKNAKSAE